MVPAAEHSVSTIKSRADFLAVSAVNSKCVKPCVIVLCAARPQQSPVKADSVRAGFTATRKLGGAVVRNRIKRRMREAVRKLLPELGIPGFDYVFICRPQAGTATFDGLILDVKHALKRLQTISKPST